MSDLKPCGPECILCAFATMAQGHYDACDTCQGPGYPCPEAKRHNEFEQKLLAYDESHGDWRFGEPQIGPCQSLPRRETPQGGAE